MSVWLPQGLHLLHVFPTFAAGGTQLRMAGIMNSLGNRASHTVISLDGADQAATAIDSGVPFRMLQAPQGKNGLLFPMTMRKVVQTVAPDLLLTYNWGAMDAVLGAGLMPLCPIIHNECGFGPDESARLKARRVLVRRLILNRIYSTVVVSQCLLKIAKEQFKLQAGKVCWIRTGVDTTKFRPGRDLACRRRAGFSDEDVVFGYVGGLRREKRLDLLISAFAGLKVRNAKLVLIGEGTCRPQLEQLTAEMRISSRVIFAGHVVDPRVWLGALDAFVLSSATEQTPNALLEAMACGLPAICTGVGDCAYILGSDTWPAIVPAGDLNAYTNALNAFAEDRQLRVVQGKGNRQRVVELYSRGRMVQEYAALYSAAVGQRV